MRVLRLHRWDLSPRDAIALQRQLSERVDRSTPFPEWFRYAAGADVACGRFSNRLFAGVVVCDVTDWSVVDSAGIEVETECPYVPGLLSFRESPGLLEAFSRLSREPDVVLVDGAGFAHPRRFGLACHIGLLLDRPTIGCAKSRLIGTFSPPGSVRGSSRQLLDRGEVIGRVLRTRTGVKPLFVSVGHKLPLEDAARIVLACCPRHRLPEPVRLAHRFVGNLRTARLAK
jgi:deoxyribonuclease V